MSHGYQTQYLANFQHYIYIKSSPNPAVKKNLIWIQGGPGVPSGINVESIDRIPDLTDHFNIILWDPPRVGKSFTPFSTSKFNIDTVLEALDEVVEYLAQTNGHDVVLYGESFGSLIAYLYSQLKPDKILKLVTSAQVSNVTRSEELSRQYILKFHHTKLAKQMQKSYEKGYLLRYYLTKINILKSQGGYFGPAYKPNKLYNLGNIFNGFYSGLDYKFLLNPFSFVLGLQQDLVKTDLFTHPELQVPVTFIIGKYDYMVPWELSLEFCNQVSSPAKEIVLLDKAGHDHFREAPQTLAQILIS